MQLPFYHRIIPLNHLVYVGDFNVPPNTQRWSIPVVERTCTYFEGPHFVPPNVTGQVIEYRRQKGEIFDCFVADVPLVIEQKKDETQA